MANLVDSDLVKWELNDYEAESAKILAPDLHRKLQTMNAELAENISEFVFAAGGESGVLLNSVDFWMLRGRRSLVLQLLQEHREAVGKAIAASPATGGSTADADSIVTSNGTQF